MAAVLLLGFLGASYGSSDRCFCPCSSPSATVAPPPFHSPPTPSSPPPPPAFHSTPPPVSLSLEISYGGVPVRIGSIFSCRDTVSTPQIRVTGHADPNQLYSLIMLDRRASRSIFSIADQYTYIHYWVANIRGSSINNGDGTLGRVLEGYMQPAPHDYLLHNYEFLLVPQQQVINTPLADRFVKDVDSMMLQYNLGKPVATTSFTEQLRAGRGC
ncbi:26 kDa secreted antigen-like [Selaginella moellendorffii]|uniref:26 kDa secreted antigen-like n=1 Tax=Selaginella moellendorffii TaxID=88036 RepID=UPI000D1C76BC|nr:26 kDa secreted antigen-like [Selaginella moellendorffii]|eukprot:XP_024535742.1 26 kDa secreted antigen-like [Selaginella moellendorffii]